MHELLAQVLTNRDLSRAGDLFSIDDKNLVTDISEVLSKIQEIASASDFTQNDNNQSVVEICITRVTSAIRDTGTIEQHAPAMVSLLESCLNHDLRPLPKDEDPPHAKIASDIVSCIFLNHSKKSVMKLALPVAVKFLHRGNKELSRNLSSYLSLAAINNADLLAVHVQPIIDSIISGNYSLTRVLPQIYIVNKEPIHEHVMALVSLLPQCENADKLSLLNLFSLIAKHKSSLLESNLPHLSECLTIPSAAASALQIFLDMAAVRPQSFTEHVQKMKMAAELQPGTLILVARILGIIGKLNQERAKDTLEFLIAHLGKVDQWTLMALLRVIKSLTDMYPSLLPQYLTSICNQVEPSASSNIRIYLQQLKMDCRASKNQQIVNQTSCGITIVKVGGVKSDHTNGTPSPFNCHIPPILPHSSNKTVHNGFQHSRSRHNLPGHAEARSMSQLGSFQTINRSMGRLPSSMSTLYYQSASRLSSPIGLHTSMMRLGSSSAMNRSMTAVNYKNVTIPIAGISSGGVTVMTTMSTPQKGISDSMPTLQEEGPVTVSIGNAQPVSGNESCGLRSSQSTSTTTSVSPSFSIPVSSAVTSHIVSPPTATVAYSCNSDSIPNAKLRNTSGVTVITHSGSQSSSNPQRISVFEPYPMRDAVQHFCEKHLDKIKAYMVKVFVKIPLPVRCTIEERKARKHAKIYFACQGKGEHCLYNKTFFIMKTRNPRVWIHLMFLALQARASMALSTREASVSSLKNCWDTLKADNKSFLTLVTSAFPSAKDQDTLINELRTARFFDVFEYNGPLNIWGCFLCNHPDRARGFLQDTQPVIEGQLKEKKGKWKIFRRWRTRYFTLSAGHLSYRGSQDEKEVQPIDISQIRSVRAISSRGRNIPKAFEIFTNEKTFVLKAKDSKNTEQWVQCLSIAMAHSHSKDL
ncbi:protein melted [Parasteatoda tepidariorum]|uniref:Protein melted n=1 Tax=Parasteatoda tepidariorum TaxID=114398 RepID=A0A2L2YK59_PARTP|nr:protein melted [Parasteatoda tepidariorum]XP_015906320.1 protein melted [Parasteatoda tepidariorum]XP_042896570.1 protein melted [Parasteatoda tepidariorum]